MKFYFLRHATAAEAAPTDALRPLTREGQDEARAAGLALARLGVEPGAVLTSPLLRARQTAELAAISLAFPRKIVVLDELKNGASTTRLLQALQPYAHVGQVLLVGHLPSLPIHVAALTGMERAEALRMGKGAIACVELDSFDAPPGALRWLAGKKLLSLLSKI